MQSTWRQKVDSKKVELAAALEGGWRRCRETLLEGGQRINRDPGLAIFGALGFGICQINYLGSGIGTFAGTRDWGFEKIWILDLRV